jgi:hypothetical protein
MKVFFTADEKVTTILYIESMVLGDLYIASDIVYIYDIHLCLY